MSYNNYINYSLDPIDKPRLYGLYKGVVTDNTDSTNSNKLSVMVPQLIGGQSFDSVAPCVAPGSSFILPAIGDNVWVAFEAGDLSYPVWLGSSTPYTGSMGNFGSFISTTTQTSSTTAAAVTFNSAPASNGITLFSSSKLKFLNSGIYKVQFLGQVYQSTNGTPVINIWMRKNGSSDIPNSTWQYDLSNQNHYAVPSFSYIGQFLAGEYVEIYWNSTSTTYLQYTAASTSPPYPATSSALVNIQQV